MTRPALLAVAVAAVAVAALTGSLAVAGPLGLVVAADCLAAVGLLLALTGVPHLAAPTGGKLAAPIRGILAAGRRGKPVVQATEFPTYLKVSSDLGWAPVSRWHYDHGTRLLLARLLEVALAEGQHVDAATDPARARQLAGEEVWRLVTPGPRHDSNAPGVDLRTLGQITDRLEQLWPDPLERP